MLYYYVQVVVVTTVFTSEVIGHTIVGHFKKQQLKQTVMEIILLWTLVGVLCWIKFLMFKSLNSNFF